MITLGVVFLPPGIPRRNKLFSSIIVMSSRTIQYHCRTALFSCLRDDDLTKTLNSLPTVTPDRLSHFPRQKKQHRPLFSGRRVPQKWLKHGLFRSLFSSYELAERLSRHALRPFNCSLHEHCQFVGTYQ